MEIDTLNVSRIPPTLWLIMWPEFEENMSLNEDAFCLSFSKGNQELNPTLKVYVASRLKIAFIGTPNIEQQQNCHSMEVDDTSCMKKTDNFLLKKGLF